MLNADRVSAGDFLKLMVSGSQIHQKQTIVKQNKVGRAGCRTIIAQNGFGNAYAELQ